MEKSYIISFLYLLLIYIASAQNIIFGGSPLLIVGEKSNKSCTASFIYYAPKPPNSIIYMIVTDGRCSMNGYNDSFSTADGSEILGYTEETAFGNSDPQVGGLDFTILNVTINYQNVKQPQFTPYVIGPSLNNDGVDEIYSVTSYLTPTETGLEVCAYGQKSGYRCGKLIELDVEVPILNPWENGTKLVKGLNKVDMGGNGFEHEEDLGGPVYFVNVDGKKKTAQALGHIVDTNNDDPEHKILYYMPLKNIVNRGYYNLTLFTVNGDNIEVNLTNPKLKRQENKNRKSKAIFDNNIYGGYPIGVGGQIDKSGQRCTTSFAMIRDGGTNGILTAGHCAVLNKDENVYVGTGEDADTIGNIEVYELGDIDGNDFAFINVNSRDVLPCVIAPDNNNIYQKLAVTSDITLSEGSNVCAFGVVSLYICGEIIEIGASTRFLDANRNWQILTDLIYVDTGNKKFVKGDSGGPAFIKTSDTTAQAVGHIVGGFQLQNINILAITPIKKVLEYSSGRFKLLTADSC
ncbi:hypothetical protein C2G38_2057044 [Gigaspora rosea]|uniref:Peptidase S1 domain-containing protein n=1 Tax=Gigaspora rosea TaxID=44941 RepID=A0A397W5C5_9GLOM|nr:hypothetical protein C2G38_2057044 [Gigaspora rosea]